MYKISACTKFVRRRIDEVSPHTSFYRATLGICRRHVSVCLSVCVRVSDTLRYCIKTAKRRITQIMPYDRSGTLSLY